MHFVPDDLIRRFQESFGAGSTRHRVHLVRAPGRVNLIGEHTDYNEGFVFPMAIEPEVRLACRAREDGWVRLISTVFPSQIVEFSLETKIEPGEPRWANYSRGVVAEMAAAGIPLAGMDCLLTTTLPVGGGLSSSAAVEVATALGLLAAAGQKMDAGRIALLCQKAEQDYAGVPVGIMDQTAVASGTADHAMLLDCRDLSRRFVPIDSQDLRVVVANTMVKHELTGGEYAQRRRECEQGVAFFRQTDPAVRALRDVTMGQVLAAQAQLPAIIFKRCRHVVGENARTTEAAEQLARQRYDRVGALMAQSHQSLRDDYEVSCPELDFLADAAMKVKGVYGARMTGGGFGGCIVALVQPRAVEALSEHLTQAYKARFEIEPTVFSTAAAPGAALVE